MAKRGCHRSPKTKSERTANKNEEHRPYTRGKRRQLPSSWDDLQNNKANKEIVIIKRWIRSKLREGVPKDDAMPLLSKKFPEWEKGWLELIWRLVSED